MWMHCLMEIALRFKNRRRLKIAGGVRLKIAQDVSIRWAGRGLCAWLFSTGAQRMVVGGIEETCRMSNGAKWAMLIDKMDQQKSILPAMAAQNKTPFFANGERLVVGLIGSAWAGVKHTDHLIRTVYQNLTQGACMQSSTILRNLHATATLEGRLPEEFVINADNTPKETKNQVTIWFLIWLLCCMEGTTLWSTLVVFLIVGHTHNRLDRFFGRVATAIAGRDYFTMGEFRDIVDRALPGFHVRWAHCDRVWDWTELKDSLPNFKRLRNVHAINVFRQGGIWIKWKMYLTDQTWSRARLLVPPGDVRRIAALRPAEIPIFFQRATRSAMHSWLERLASFLDGLPGDVLRARRAHLEWLHAVVDGREGDSADGADLDDMVKDLRTLGEGGKLPEPLPLGDYNEDALFEAFPGADHPSLPQDCLVEITGLHEPELPAGLVLPGMYVVVRASLTDAVRGSRLPFLLGRHLPDAPNQDGGTLLVEWFVPPTGRNVAPKPGPKAEVEDIFGVWLPSGSVAVDVLGNFSLPSSLVEPVDILHSFPECNDEGGIPYEVFDVLRREHNIDCTGMNATASRAGQQYRHYVLMRRGA